MAAAASSWRDARADERPSSLMDASALIRSIREQEAWVDRTESLWLKAEVVHETTPAGIARRRHELEKQGRAGADLEKARGLRPRSSHIVEFARDRTRLRSWDDWDPDWFDLRVWDGKRLIAYVSYDTPAERRDYRISDGPAAMASQTLGTFGFHAGPHRFWWYDRPEDRDAEARLMGRPEDYTYGGRETFHGTECHVVSRWANWSTFYISVADGHLRGSKQGAWRYPEKRLLNWLNRRGHAFRDAEELRAWIKSLTPEQASALQREQSANMTRLVDPCMEYRLSDHREVAPGCWLPMKQERALYFLDERGRLAIEETQRLKITEAKVNVPLPDALFQIEIPAGMRIIDRTKNPAGGLQ
jgi:hypothetical protein